MWVCSPISACLAFACLAFRSHADVLDISAQFYQDPNCFVRAQDLTLLDGGCYANVFDNLTKAFLVRIVAVGSTPRFDLHEYVGTCHDEFQYRSVPRQIQGGRCTRFVGTFYVLLGTIYRSSVCFGEDCSRLNVAVQTFYSEATCTGLPWQVFKYPLQGACLRWANGTQTFSVDATFTNITQVDYIMDDICAGAVRRTYTITSGRCYGLYPTREPRSFQWTVQIFIAGAATTSSRAQKPRPSVSVLAAAVPLLALVLRGVGLHS